MCRMVQIRMKYRTFESNNTDFYRFMQQMDKHVTISEEEQKRRIEKGKPLEYLIGYVAFKNLIPKKLRKARIAYVGVNKLNETYSRPDRNGVDIYIVLELNGKLIHIGIEIKNWSKQPNTYGKGVILKTVTPRFSKRQLDYKILIISHLDLLDQNCLDELDRQNIIVLECGFDLEPKFYSGQEIYPFIKKFMGNTNNAYGQTNYRVLRQILFINKLNKYYNTYLKSIDNNNQLLINTNNNNTVNQLIYQYLITNNLDTYIDYKSKIGYFVINSNKNSVSKQIELFFDG